jgi:hypothetical protein
MCVHHGGCGVALAVCKGLIATKCYKAATLLAAHTMLCLEIYAGAGAKVVKCCFLDPCISMLLATAKAHSSGGCVRVQGHSGGP